MIFLLTLGKTVDMEFAKIDVCRKRCVHVQCVIVEILNVEEQHRLESFICFVVCCLTLSLINLDSAAAAAA